MRRRQTISNHSYEFETYINSDDISVEKLDEFIRVMKQEGFLHDAVIDYHDGGLATFDDFPVLVEFGVVPPSKGMRGEYGVPLEPDTDAYIEEIVVSACGNKKRYDITDYFDDVHITYEEACMEHASESSY